MHTASINIALLAFQSSTKISYVDSRSVGQSIGRSVGRSVGLSVGRSVGRSFGRSVDLSVRLSVGLSVNSIRVRYSPVPNITWSRRTGNKTWTENAAHTEATISNLSLSDAGEYVCQATNRMASLEQNIQLTVNG